MILRRLAEAIRRQDWFTVLLEIVIVMIGIFLGLQVNAWNQSRIDRAEEAVFLQALYQDVIELEKISGRLVSIRVKSLERIGNAAEILNGRVAWRDLTNEECSAIATSGSTAIAPAGLPSWTALRDAGRTGILKDADLRRALATLSQRRESLDRITAAVDAASNDIDSMQPDLFKIVPVLTELDDGTGRPHYVNETTCDSVAISKNQAVMNALSDNLNGFSGAVRIYGIVPWAEQVTKIRIILEKNIQQGA